MSYTRTQIRDRVMRNADAYGSTRWDTTAGAQGEVDQKIGVAMDREWKRILNANRFYRSAKRTPTSSATTGLYAMADLDSPNPLTGDSQQRFYRVLKLIVDTVEYDDVSDDVESYLNTWMNAANQGLVYGFRSWWRLDTNIYTLPIQLSKAADGIWVNHIPTRFDQLASDSSTVTFPDGYEDVLCWEAAADLLMKGAAETAGSMELRAMADLLRSEMLDDLARVSTQPTRFRYGDSKEEWGSK